YVLSLLETVEDDGNRALWVGTYGGLAKLKDGEWTVFDTGSGLPDNAVIGLLETYSSDGVRSLWVGTYNGLARLENGKWIVYNTGSGLPNNFVTGLHTTKTPDGKRYLWVGTFGGVARLGLDEKNPSWFTFNENTKPALPDNNVYRIEEDFKHRIYLFTNKGVARLTPRAPTPEDPSEYSIYTFTMEDGLPGNECNQNGSMVDSLGRIWAGTISGAAVFDPSKEIEDRAPKPLYIEQIILNGIEKNIAKQALSYKENNVTFEFALLGFFRQKET